MTIVRPAEVGSVPEVNPRRSKIFVSYSRKDRAFVEKLVVALTSRHRQVWVDWQDIPPTAEWLRECFYAIDAADALVFVISPASMASEICSQELAHGMAQNKRIVPLLLQAVSSDGLPEAIRKINWVIFEPNVTFEEFVQRLEHALDLDLEWLRIHTRVPVRAREWESKGKITTTCSLAAISMRRKVGLSGCAITTRSPRHSILNTSQRANNGRSEEESVGKPPG